MTWYDAQFDDGATRYTVGPFDTPDEADEFGQAHHGEHLDYTGWAERRGKRELEQLVGAALAAAAAAGLDAGTHQRTGIVTRWDAGATHGFITDVDGRSWFVSRDDLPAGLTDLPLQASVVFAGGPAPKPGKRYPQAYSVSIGPDA